MSEESVIIDRLNARGWGIGSLEKAKVEVIGGIPGDSLGVKLFKKRRGVWRADLLRVLSASAQRTAPRCAHVPLCGGCTWQQMDYAAQLQEKERRVARCFPDVHIEPIIPCEDPWHYRNKMEFSFSQNKAGEKFLGLIIAGSKGHVMNLRECQLVSPWFMSALQEVRGWWEASGLGAYRLNDTGTLRTLILREGKRTGDKLAMLTVSGNPEFGMSRSQLQGFVDAVQRTVSAGERLSVFLRVQQVCKGSATQFYEMHLAGPDHLLEKLHLDRELTFKVSPTSFFQPNTLQAEKLYMAALDMVNGTKKHALDLYAGTATLGMAMASRAEKVTSIEINPHACFDAGVNKELNGIAHLEILCGDVGKKLGELKGRKDFVPPDLVIVDPPRTGLDKAAIDLVKELRPKEILYISCNPETQAANIQEILPAGYKLAKVQPVDQFPHTPHIENIAVLFA